MALKVELKPHERVIIGATMITNSDRRAKFTIEGEHIPILRERDIITPEMADTPAKQIYLAVQLMYLARDPRECHEVYFSLVRDVLHTAPSMWTHIEAINTEILAGSFYKALKEARRLIDHEAELLELARQPLERDCA